MIDKLAIEGDAMQSDLDLVLEVLDQAGTDARKIDAAGVEVTIVDRHGAGIVYRYFADEVDADSAVSDRAHLN